MSVKVKFGLCLVNHLTVKTYREVEVLPYAFLISAVQACTQEGGGAAAGQTPPPNLDLKNIFADTMISDFYAIYPSAEISQ